MHVLLNAKYLNAYSSKEKTILEKLMDFLAEKIFFFEHINLNEHLFTMAKHTHYILMKKLKTHGLTISNIALFSQNYSGALAKMYFIWLTDIQLKSFLQTKLMNNIQAFLLNTFLELMRHEHDCWLNKCCSIK